MASSLSSGIFFEHVDAVGGAVVGIDFDVDLSGRHVAPNASDHMRYVPSKPLGQT